VAYLRLVRIPPSVEQGLVLQQ